MTERFVQIKTAFLRDPNLSLAQKAVGSIVATYADRNGVAWPGLRRLMRDAHVSKHTIEKVRASLVRAGYLEKFYVKRKGKFTGVRYRVSRKVLHRRSP